MLRNERYCWYGEYRFIRVGDYEIVPATQPDKAIVWQEIGESVGTTQTGNLCISEENQIVFILPSFTHLKYRVPSSSRRLVHGMKAIYHNPASDRGLAAAPIGSMHFEFGHEQQIEQAVTVVSLEHDHRAARGRLRHKVRMVHVERSPIRHANGKRIKRLQWNRC